MKIGLIGLLIDIQKPDIKFYESPVVVDNEKNQILS